MALDKILSKIQVQIEELAPALELFIEESIQPSVSDCDDLQARLSKLQENLAVYKYYKQERELSPSFNIHSKVSGKNVSPEIRTEEEITEKESFNSNPEEKKPKAHDLVTDQAGRKDYPPMAVGINDKFRFINEMFKQNGSEYNIAIEQLNSLQSWQEAELYLASLKSIYNWKDNSEAVLLLHSLVKKRFY